MQKKQYLTLNDAIKDSRSAFIAVGFFSFFINLLMLTGPLFMLQIYDRVLASRSLPTLAVLFILVTALFLILGLLEFIRSRVLARVGVHITKRIHARIFNSVMQLSLRTGGSPSSTAPLRELDTVTQYLCGPSLSIFFDAPWVPIYIFVIFVFHPILGWLAVSAAIILFIIALLNDIRARKPSKQLSQTMSQSHHLAETGRRNGEALAAMGMLGALRKRWVNKYNEMLIVQTNSLDRSSTLSAFSKAFRLFVQSAMLAAGAMFVIYGQITPGVMIAASIILGRALQPVEQAITQWRNFVKYREAKNHLNSLLKNIPAPTEKTPLTKPIGKLSLSALYAGAPGSKKPFLQNINFTLPAGKILGVTGDSASGKTMLARVITNVWQPMGGDLRLDEATYDQWSSDKLGKYMGYLPQDVELFDGTIAQNISRLEEDCKAEQIIDAAKQAGVHDLIKQIGGYDVHIGTGGSNLSAGQRQQIALARALFSNPSLIVLDEPNSNLDESGEAALFEAINKMRERKQTVVIITHRKNILTLVDDLLVLHKGKQVAWGKKEDVISKIFQEHNIKKNRIKGSNISPMPNFQSGYKWSIKTPSKPAGENQKKDTKTNE